MRKISFAVLASCALLLTSACRRAEEAVSPATPPDSVAQTPAAAPPTAAPSVGQRMVPYVATWMDGTKFDLAEKKGRVVLLNLWATWCGPCRYEIPELQSLHDQQTAQGLDVIGVSVDEGGSQLVKEFVEQRKMTYPIVLDPEGKLAAVLETSVLPTTILIDRGGMIVWKRYGPISGNDPELQKALKAAL